MSESTAQPVVLVIDDEPDLIEILKLWLSDSYEVRAASSGEAGLDALDDTIDVVLLDRRMPGVSGDEVLSEIRDRGGEYQVGFVTATDPGFDLINLAFDTFVMKPLDEDTVIDTVERLLARIAYDDTVQERYTVAETLSLLDERKTEGERATSERYQRLRERFESLDDAVATDADELSRDDL